MPASCRTFVPMEVCSKGNGKGVQDRLSPPMVTLPRQFLTVAFISQSGRGIAETT